MAIDGLGAVVGYAVGTFQVLFVDWWRRVAAHRRHLTLLQADLRRMRGFEREFGWIDGRPTAPEIRPIPPRASDLFVKTVGDCEWRLSDEYRDDNSQQSFLYLLDGLALLHHSVDEVLDVNRRVGAAADEELPDLRRRAATFADQYDDVLEQVLYQIDDCLRDLDRRLGLATFGEQLNRAFVELPPGKASRPFDRGDPFYIEWKRRRAER